MRWKTVEELELISNQVEIVHDCVLNVSLDISEQSHWNAALLV